MLYQSLKNISLPASIEDLSISHQLKVLVLAPHPDDFDAIGITQRCLYNNRNNIYLAVLTTGESGVEDEYCKSINNYDKASIREHEQIESIKFFGLPVDNLTFLRLASDSTGHLIMNESNFEKVDQVWRKCNPDIVFLPHGNDTNLDHQRTFQLFKRLTANIKKPVLAFYNKDPKTISIRNDVQVTFDETAAKWKAELLRFHQSQHQRNLRTRGFGFDDRILNVNKKDAADLQLNAEYVEIFELEVITPSYAS